MIGFSVTTRYGRWDEAANRLRARRLRLSVENIVSVTPEQTTDTRIILDSLVQEGVIVSFSQICFAE